MIMSDGSLRMRRDNRLPPDWRACLSLAGHYYPGVLNALSGPVVPRVRTGARAERSAAATHQPSCNQVMSGSRRGSPILCARWPVAINYSALKGKVWCSDSMLAMRFRPCWRVDGRPVMDCRKTGSLCAHIGHCARHRMTDGPCPGQAGFARAAWWQLGPSCQSGRQQHEGPGRRRALRTSRIGLASGV